jgi:CubicO group peptidase (beta-lactamase class C family)
MKSRARLLIFLLLAVTITITAADSPPSSSAGSARLAAIPEALEPFIDGHEISGAVTLVADHAHVLELGAIGKADLADSRPMRDDTIFCIASMTKPVTAAAILMLRDEGKLSIDDPVSKYCPELGGLKTRDGKAAVVTIRHCLTHTSGMDEPSPQQARAAKNLAELIPHFAEKPLLFAPGSQWKYCQSAINTLGRVVEVASGQSLPDFLERRLFKPLDMKDTTFYPSPAQIERLAINYKKTGDKLEAVAVGLLGGHSISDRDRYPAANGGLFSTAPDYGRFFRMLLNKGTFEGKQYLKVRTVEQMSTIQTGELKTGFTPGNGWGLGVCVVREPQGVTEMLSPGTFGHGGAYGTQAWIDPKRDRVYVLMVQRANFPISDESDVRKAFIQASAQK